MLKKLILENWKSFRYAELPLDPLTVLIGTNASGKSNVVEALEFLQRIANGENIETALAGDKTLSSIRGGVELAARKGENEFTLKVLVGAEDDADYLYNLQIQTLPSFKLCEEYLEIIDMNNNDILKIKLMDFYYQAKSGLHFKGTRVWRLSKTRRNDKKILEQPTDVEEDNQKYLKLPKIATNFTIDNLSNLLVLNPISSKMRDYSRLSENIESDGSNIAGVLAGLPDDKKTEIENTLSEYLKDLPEGDIKKVWAEPVGRLKTDAMLYCQEEWKPGEITEIDARSMSDGTLRFLAILTALLTRPEGSQIVIEEIDNGLHPSRAALLVKILKEIGTKRNIDILLTTHNPALLDAFGPEIVPFVVVAHRDSETGESKLTLLEDIDNFPKLFASYSLGQMTTKGAIERSLSHGE
ncbi:AAA family ATPase [Dolichospermum sp. LEGE 00240]|uniref:AAA family ATPase n=1 Tax=Dolichospermum sp. LEGE 00240 TaxID=1828603 RepID=UPI001881C537|nr:ATP-binding protein [Dolichospermum sp. LEGE 00240]MBE9249730.1 AAA family ATPase [Dolichospermum sp. LEGE 00240]MDM3850426.1 AAA family ATPase [Aphanizomenon gracile PMC627.10]